MRKLILLIFVSLKGMSYDIDNWESTQYVYLAKPVYIYKVESTSEDLGGKLGNTLKDLVVKIEKASATKNIVYYYFEIQEILYGKPEVNFSLEFEFEGEYEECNMKSNFQNHDNNEFWNTEIGRSQFSTIKLATTNCFGEYKDTRHVDSCFEIDKLYLLIGNDQLKTKQFELIESENDEWLQFVRKKSKELK